MKVGDYCYIKGISRDYGIGKITQLNSGYSSNGGELIDIQFKHSKHSVPKKDVISSDSPIDLIEVGDYVNGYKVLEICEGNFDSNNPHNVKALKLEFIEQNINSNVPFFKRYIFIFDKDIKSIVTKEQFKSIEYEVK